MEHDHFTPTFWGLLFIVVVLLFFTIDLWVRWFNVIISYLFGEPNGLSLFILAIVATGALVMVGYYSGVGAQIIKNLLQ